ncbi:MAG: hypothetical protein JRI34_12080, partial [Deltaproteobacteria bacterium]|nr:hypothetical protein [Deltaproteobacteria bacterium]
MSWSLNSVSYRMSGSGSWQYLLPDEHARRIYVKIYPETENLNHLQDQAKEHLTAWRQAKIIKIEGRKVVSLGPIMTDRDLEILDPWFKHISDSMCAAVLKRLPDYHLMALRLAGGKSAPEQKVKNIFTIQICAHTLDSWIFALLRRELIGAYPPRDFAGYFFFWGYAFARGPQRIFGFTTYRGPGGKGLHVIRSHGLDRERLKAVLRRRDTYDFLERITSGALTGGISVSSEDVSYADMKNNMDSLRSVNILTPDDPPRLSIPVFAVHEMKLAAELYEAAARETMGVFLASLDELKVLVKRCSFARCAWPDILCMLFHLAYSYAADKL